MTDSNNQNYNQDPVDPMLAPANDQNNSALDPQVMDMSAGSSQGPGSSDMGPSGTNDTASLTSEALEDQNIFELLGVNDGSDQEKESFLDELQQVIWEDFLENDLQLLVTQDELTKVRGLLDDQGKTEDERQEAAVNYLETLIPDLEEIMLEKALELKEEMVKERIAGMKEFYAGQTDKLQKIDEAEKLMLQDKWLSMAKMLNELGKT